MEGLSQLITGNGMDPLTSIDFVLCCFRGPLASRGHEIPVDFRLHRLACVFQICRRFGTNTSLNGHGSWYMCCKFLINLPSFFFLASLAVNGGGDGLRVIDNSPVPDKVQQVIAASCMVK